MKQVVQSLSPEAIQYLSDDIGFDRVRFAFDGSKASIEVESMLSLLKGMFDSMSVERNQRSRLMRISVEVIQNIVKHGIDQSATDVYILLSSDKSKLQFTSCNVVSNSDKDRISAKFESLVGLDADGLKTAFRQALKDSTIDHKGGAGIGLVDIAYRTGEVPTYDFVPINDTDFCHYILTSKLVDLD